MSDRGASVALTTLPARDQIEFLREEAACYEETLNWIRERIDGLESNTGDEDEQTGG